MSENPLEFGMVCVVVKLTLCYVFQRVLFFCRVRRWVPIKHRCPVRRANTLRLRGWFREISNEGALADYLDIFMMPDELMTIVEKAMHRA